MIHSDNSVLQVRVQQTVRSQESSIVSYKIANLLQFYLMTMRRTIGEQALLSTTLKECVLSPSAAVVNELISFYSSRITDVAYKVFYDSIETQSRALSRTHIVRVWSIFQSVQKLICLTIRIWMTHPSRLLMPSSTTLRYCAK